MKLPINIFIRFFLFLMKILLFLWSDYFIIRAFLSDAIPLRNVMRNVQSIPTTLCAVLPASRNE